MAEAAELRAEDGVGAGCGGGEMDVEGLAGDGVLFEAGGLGDGEAVDDVLGVEAEVCFAVGGEDESEVTSSSAEWGSVGSRLEGCLRRGLRVAVSDAEGGVGAGVAEVPGELDSGGFDLQGGEGGSGVAGGSPEALGFDGEGGEEDGKEGERKVFDAPEVFLCSARRLARRPAEKDEVGEGEEGEGDPEVEEEMVV